MSEFNEDPMDADIADDWAAALSEQHNMGDDMADNFGGPGQANRGVELPQGDVNLDVILDVPVTIAMEIGRTRISIRNLLQLSQGSVVELDRLAGEPLDVYVNGTLIAHGEVVVVNDKFGIRLTDVISPTERIKKLK
ncbi:MAG: flagellar motor switch protein FliN [Methylococcaceae bacterium]|nr:MAG: flagellar motor switch protein FliN [Methylococcaceae bacterium]